MKDFQSIAGVIEMQVLGLIGKLLSGPWMKLFYVSASDQSVNHVDTITIIEEVVVKLKEAAKANRNTSQIVFSTLIRHAI